MRDRTSVRRVAIVQRSVRRYRAGFFDGLRDELARDHVELRLFHSNLAAENDPRPDALTIPWAVHLPRRTVRLGSRNLLWQSYHGALRTADLVIVEQAADLALNYRLLGAQRRGGPRVAMWGHGRDFSQVPTHVVERVKRRTSLAAHWWFAYTQRSADVVAGIGFPPDRITTVNNAIDSTALRAELALVRASSGPSLRDELGIGDGPVGLFLGSLRPNKGLDLLLAAGARIAAARPDFNLIVVGGGDLEQQLHHEATRTPWLHMLGPQFGQRRAAALDAANVVLVPSWVGLVVVDALASGTPLIAAADCLHPPEIDYLRDGENGLLVQGGSDPARYAAAVLDVIGNGSLAARLAAGCREDASRYSVETMVGRFADGIRRALVAPHR